MHTDAPARRVGRLSREDQRRLGDILQRVYNEVVGQGVPDRFRLILHEIDEPGARPGGETGKPSPSDRADAGRDAETDRLVPAKAHDRGLADPRNEGSG